MKRQPLGRGLDAILGGATPKPTATRSSIHAVDDGPAVTPGKDAGYPNDAARLLAIETIVAGRGQPRRSFAEAPLEELAQSIREKGVLQPLIVSEGPSGFELIAGERRLRAAARAGLTKVPVIVKCDVAHGELLELALIENIQREDLTAMEEARAYKRLIDDHGHTREELGKRLGKSRATISNTLRLLGLPQPIQQLVDAGELSEGHARALLRFSSSAEQIRYARRCVQHGLSVREIEELAKRATAGSREPAQSRAGRGRPAATPLEDSLTRELATKVRIRAKGAGGSIEIHYHSNEELTRLVDRLRAG